MNQELISQCFDTPLRPRLKLLLLALAMGITDESSSGYLQESRLCRESGLEPKRLREYMALLEELAFLTEWHLIGVYLAPEHCYVFRLDRERIETAWAAEMGRQ